MDTDLQAFLPPEMDMEMDICVMADNITSGLTMTWRWSFNCSLSSATKNHTDSANKNRDGLTPEKVEWHFQGDMMLVFFDLTF